MSPRKSFGRLGNAAVARGLRGARRGGPRVTLAAALLLAIASCGGAPSAATFTGSQSVAYTGAAITAVAAGVLWAVGGGCKLQGCPYGSYCNQKTGFCDVRKCSEGCPDFTICNEGLGRCQAA